MIAYDLRYQSSSSDDSVAIAIAPGEPAPAIRGDLNGDNFVDNEDLGALLASYLKCAGDAAFNGDADFNADGCVNNEDLGVLLSNYLRGA